AGVVEGEEVAHGNGVRSRAATPTLSSGTPGGRAELFPSPPPPGAGECRQWHSPSLPRSPPVTGILLIDDDEDFAERLQAELHGRLMKERVALPSEDAPPECATRLLGNSPAMRQIYDRVGKVAESNASVLILGETGTGKELIARAIFQYSRRADKPFIAFNCA